MLGTFLHMLQGTPYIYQGEEIGMTNVAFETIEEYNDVEIHNFYNEHVIEGNLSHEEAMRMIRSRGRDNARTPMQWSSKPEAGFTTGKPWLKINPNYLSINVEQALADPDSIFYYYQKLIRLRKREPAIVYGIYDLILPDHEQIYAFTRTLDDQRLLVVLNFSAGEPIFVLPESIKFRQAELLIANYPIDAAADITRFQLRPYEARVYKLV
jgi:oligo-1,6-glucosidase